jgi:hypothetical protein
MVWLGRGQAYRSGAKKDEPKESGEDRGKGGDDETVIGKEMGPWRPVSGEESEDGADDSEGETNDPRWEIEALDMDGAATTRNKAARQEPAKMVITPRGAHASGYPFFWENINSVC